MYTHIPQVHRFLVRLLLGAGFAIAFGIATTARAEDSLSTTTDSDSALDAYNPAQVEARVREYFKDIPVMIEIARCESGYRQFDAAGNVLDGGAGAMMGVFQIHEHLHRRAAEVLGLDFHTLEGNLSYARHLYELEGTQPWVSAFPCWNKAAPKIEGSLNTAISAESIASISGALTKNVSVGIDDPEVRTLQVLLNNAGFTIVESGPGSPGNETTKFGAFTRAAVRRFQCVQKIVCAGDEFSTGYGYVGPRTRAALAETVGKTPSAMVSASIDVDASTDAPQGSAALLESSNVEEKVSTVASLEAQIAALSIQVNALLAQIATLQRTAL